MDNKQIKFKGPGEWRSQAKENEPKPVEKKTIVRIKR